MKINYHLYLWFLIGIFLFGCVPKTIINTNATIQVTISPSVTHPPEATLTIFPMTATPSAELVKMHIDNDYFAIVSLLDWVSNDELYSRIPYKKTYDMDYLYIDLRNDTNMIIPRYAPGVTSEDLAFFIDQFDGETEQVYVSPDGNQFVIFVNAPGSSIGVCPCHNYDLWKYDKLTGEYILLADKNSEFQKDHIILMLQPNDLIINDEENYVFVYHSRYPYHEFVNLQTGEYSKFESNGNCRLYDRPIYSGNGEIIIVGDGIFHRDDYFNFMDRCESIMNDFEQEDGLVELIFDDFRSKYAIADISEDLVDSDEFFEMNTQGDHYYYNDISSGDSENVHIGNIVRVNIGSGETYIVIPEEVIRKNGLDVPELTIRVSPDENRFLIIPEPYEKDVYFYSLTEFGE